jgi:hypothetical protein
MPLMTRKEKEELIQWQQNFLRRLEHLGYRDRRKYLRKMRQHFPRFFYKYIALDPAAAESVDHLRDIIVRSRFWLSAPVDFNDPFDFTIKMIVEGTVLKRRQRWNNILKTQPLTSKERKQKLISLMRKTPEELEKLVQVQHEGLRENVGVYCFAGDPRSILMWSHYASKHTGLCLQFEVARDAATFLLAIPVV